MSAHITVTCDGHRDGQPCRGSRPTRDAILDDALVEATAHGWRLDVAHPDRGHVGDLCPSRGHDEEPTP